MSSLLPLLFLLVAPRSARPVHPGRVRTKLILIIYSDEEIHGWLPSSKQPAIGDQEHRSTRRRQRRPRRPNDFFPPKEKVNKYWNSDSFSVGYPALTARVFGSIGEHRSCSGGQVESPQGNGQILKDALLGEETIMRKCSQSGVHKLPIRQPITGIHSSTGGTAAAADGVVMR